MPTDEESLELKPQIERIARAVANRCNASRTVRAELLDDAVGHVFSVYHMFDPQVASFPTWCFTVLRNRCVTLIRDEAQKWEYFEHAGAAAEVEQERQLREGPNLPPDLEGEARRARADLVVMFDRHLEPLDRLLLATYEGLLQRLGPGVSGRWLREAGRDDGPAWHAIEALPQRSRKQALARLLGGELDWLRTRMFRALRRLQTLAPDEGGP